MSLHLQQLSKRFGPVTAVSGVSLDLAGDSTMAILGPSGCGKSTLLRLVAGLERPDEGRVFLNGQDVSRVPPQRRDIGMVFQDFALFPHLDVAGNVGFGLVESDWERARIERRTAELLEMVGLAGLERRRTYELSGGQQQRVALARALASAPSLLLLDEPLSNLDPELRGSLQAELTDLLSEVEAAALYVTHDQSEAFAVAGRTAIMRGGRLVQLGTSEEVRAHPSSYWTARFLGYRNVFRTGEASLPIESAAVLVRDDLIRPGGSLETRVRAVERVDHRLRLTLQVPEWGADLSWEGYLRELPRLPSPGESMSFDIPDEAWVELQDDSGSESSDSWEATV